MTIADGQPRTQPAFPSPARPAPRPAYVIAASLLLVAAAVLALLARQGDQVETARREAIASAERRLPTLLTYRHDHLDHDLDRAVAQTTGSFHDDYEQLVSETVRPAAERRKVDTTAAVSGVGVVRTEDARVVVLAFLTQSTVTAGSAPVVRGSRVEATMVRVGDDWLIGDLEPV